MSDLMSGLEKYGFDNVNMDDIFRDTTKVESQGSGNNQAQVQPPKEEDFLLDKGMRCPVCDQVFKTRMVKSARAKRLESDQDLRPRYEYIDTIKYDVASCPHCGYTAINRYFPHLSSLQIKLIKEGVCAKYKPSDATREDAPSFTYDEAIERYKLALVNTMVKKGKTSEKAYECLKIAWLYRGKKEELEAIPNPDDSVKQQILNCVQSENAFYSQAFDGLIKATASESFPICGMEQNTVDMLIANMAFRLKKFDFASRYVSSLLVSKTASKNVKDKAFALKEEIIAEIRKNK